MSRLELRDTAMDILVKMSDGNPGALDAMMEIMAQHDKIDPQAFMGGVGAIMMLDTFEIYGSDIYILYNDKCNKDVRKMLVLIRATQLGIMSPSKLQKLGADQMREENLTDEEWLDLDKKVCEELKNFAKAT